MAFFYRKSTVKIFIFDIEFRKCTLTSFFSSLLDNGSRSRWWGFERGICVEEVGKEGEIQIARAIDYVLCLDKNPAVQLLRILQNHFSSLDQVDGI